jgi:DNA-binding response OmpR family regulator
MKYILVVEDETNIALGLEDDLTLEGYQVTLARDGEDAIRTAREQPIDLIVLDVMLPRKDGFAVCRELRRGGFKMPIIMLTARSQEAEKVLGLELGADDYVTKPFSPIELRARIKAALRRAGELGGVPNVYRFGDTEVDFGRCELRRGERTIEITSIELKLLEAFIRNRGRVLTRDQLLDAAWETGTNANDRVVDNHIVALRRKIEPEPSEPRYLYSVRGIGYRFDG